MATSFIRIPMTGAAPEDYLVSGAADIDLLSAAANFDGSGAGVDFQPAIQILDESGQVVATALGSTVTAGDSAEVTFAPFLRGASGGGGGGITEIVSGDGTVFITNPFGPVVDLSAYEPPADQEILTASLNVATGTADTFSFAHSSGSNLMDLSTPTAPKFQLFASYGVTVLFTSGTPISSGDTVIGFLDLFPVSGMNVGLRNVYAPAVAGVVTEFPISTVWHMSFNDAMEVAFRNDVGPAVMAVDATLWVQRIT